MYAIKSHIYLNIKGFKADIFIVDLFQDRIKYVLPF